MAPRQILHDRLKTAAEHVYFQLPEGSQIVYPCIVYELARLDPQFADNLPYNVRPAYQISVIDRDPDSDIVKAVTALPMCSFSSYFVTENLHHTLFTVYA